MHLSSMHDSSLFDTSQTSARTLYPVETFLVDISAFTTYSDSTMEVSVPYLKFITLFSSNLNSS